MPLSVPTAYTSRWPDAQLAVPGPDANVPPIGPHPDQPFPQYMCHIWLSEPRAKTSIRFPAHETAAGLEFRTPPSLSQPPHPEPPQYLCHSAPSSPTMKMSRRLLPHDATAGP